jgi:hypothetical protein
MDVFTMELGIWLRFVKTSDFGGGFDPPPPPPKALPLGMPLFSDTVDVLLLYNEPIGPPSTKFNVWFTVHHSISPQ